MRKVALALALLVGMTSASQAQWQWYAGIAAAGVAGWYAHRYFGCGGYGCPPRYSYGPRYGYYGPPPYWRERYYYGPPRYAYW
jgi:hypothetical protein